MSATVNPPEHYEQRTQALVLANQRRSRMTAIRQQARAGRGEFERLVMDPPPELANVPLIDVIRMSRTPNRAQKAMERLGRLAVRDGVNLMLPMGRASVRTRSWVVEHTVWNIVGSRVYVRVFEERS